MRERPAAISDPPPRRDGLARSMGLLGELMVTAGCLVLLYVIYVLWGTGVQTDQAQDDLRAEIAATWPDPGRPGTDVPGGPTTAEPQKEIELGEGYAIMRIPRLGAEWEWVVVQGVQLSDLARGPGHYADTADPGELGNLAIAGHRAGHGAPFADLDDVDVGDVVEIETATGTWRYTIDHAAEIIEPTDTWVIDPVPGDESAVEPSERRITLTTCHPRYGSSQRMFVSGLLTSGAEV